jgi:heme exporter protein D
VQKKLLYFLAVVIAAQSASSLMVVVVVVSPPQHHKLILEKLRNQKKSRNFAMIAVNMSQVSVHSVTFVILTHFQILCNIKQRQLRT